MEEQDITKIKKEAVDEFRKSKTFSAMEFAKQMQSIMMENMKEKNKVNFYKRYSPEQVSRYLADPSKYEKQLREISRYLTVSSPQYWRLINYFPSMAVISPVLIPLDTVRFRKTKKKSEKMYNEHKMKLQNMNLSHECVKILNTVFREDVFYGYEIETENSYYIKPLNPDYCRISGIYDGCFVYEFDFSYFDKYKDELMGGYYNIDKNFVRQYNLYKKKGSSHKWQELDLSREVCIKAQETFDFCCPPYVSVFNDLYDISEYKDLNKAKVEMDNTKFIGLTMETRGKDSKDLDDWILDIDTMKDYFALINSCFQGKIGTFMSPMPFKEIEFSNQKSEIDQVSNSIKSFWSSTGVADVLVGENKNAGTLKYSIKTDESLLFNVYRQIERWLTRKMKESSNGMFCVKLPNLTIFNIDDTTDKYLKASEYGYVGSKTMVDACLGFSQNDIDGLGCLENEILNKTENMIPVQSTHTQSSDNTGATEKDEGELSPSGQQTRDDSSNDNR